MKRLTTFFSMMIMASLATGLFASDPDAPPITANKFSTPPTIDGEMDAMWEPLQWHSLNYVWMEWETEYDSADYYGRFKVGWSEETDLLYFFVEVTDDVLVEKHAELNNNTFYNDIVEFFIDEDNSGGLHIFDTQTTDGEDAFSYHLTPQATPSVGNPVTDFFVSDIAGTGWGSQIPVNYFSHFDDAILITDGEQYYWEIALKVYTKDYDPSTSQGTLAELTLDKVMGLALAYCETDILPTPEREMFFGSFPGHADNLGSADGGNLYGYNDTWQNADDYNVLTLAEELTPGSSRTVVNNSQLRCHADRTSGILSFSLENDYRGGVEVEVFDLLGKRIISKTLMKQAERMDRQLETSGLNRGVYLVRVKAGEEQFVRKVLY